MYNYPWNDEQTISMQTAVQIALQQVPGQVVKVELDTENGVLVYEVDIRTLYGIYEVKVDANTGMIVRISIDND